MHLIIIWPKAYGSRQGELTVPKAPSRERWRLSKELKSSATSAQPLGTSTLIIVVNHVIASTCAEKVWSCWEGSEQMCISVRSVREKGMEFLARSPLRFSVTQVFDHLFRSNGWIAMMVGEIKMLWPWQSPASSPRAPICS